MRVLTAPLRGELKKPMGELLSGPELLEKLKRRKGPVITIGDVCSLFLLRNGVLPDVVVYDGKAMRKPIPRKDMEELSLFGGEPARVRSAPGTITHELELAVNKAISMGRGKIFVDGEEDLAALIAMRDAEPGSVVVYGQPGKGLVALWIDAKQKERARELYGRMRSVPDAP